MRNAKDSKNDKTIIKTTLLTKIVQLYRNCSSVQSLYEDAVEINVLQHGIDQIIFRNGMVSTISDDVGEFFTIFFLLC